MKSKCLQKKRKEKAASWSKENGEEISWKTEPIQMSTSWAPRTKVTTTEEWSLELNWPILYQKMLLWAKNPKIYGKETPARNPSNTVKNRNPGAMVFRFLLGKDSNTTKTTTITEKSACMQAKEFARNLEAEDEQEEWEVTNNVPKNALSSQKSKKMWEGTSSKEPIQYSIHQDYHQVHLHKTYRCRSSSLPWTLRQKTRRKSGKSWYQHYGPVPVQLRRYNDWSGPGEPASPPGGSGSTPSSNQGPGSSTPRSRNEAEKGGQQLP